MNNVGALWFGKGLYQSEVKYVGQWYILPYNPLQLGENEKDYLDYVDCKCCYCLATLDVDSEYHSWQRIDRWIVRGRVAFHDYHCESANCSWV